MKAKCDCCGKMVDSKELEIIVIAAKEFDGAICPPCLKELTK